ncbi:Pathogenesis-related protein like [Actinidia chinensis var. chinensis]|uniref:Pathogenesis-related protein like n=1 Tax=Actinidia chinensis var. chinensis TaxID=1590841 RepID=A0A2R6PW93_ACTCC|nr:pathogenesis-related protein STH-21-like [Actinidia eriantha]XP_057487169.1 pathogenesis-related protein STH-21-like [Actinidia eriantha]PSR98009.1 Pathogenesis-related protein like [Actinidia chinensis var. chinensis]
MGVVKISQTFKTQVTPSRMFKALILDSHNLCPKLMFSSIKSIELLEGTGEAGSIKQMNFTEASPLKYVKLRIDELDKENFKCKYTFIEVEGLMHKLDSISYDVRFEPYGFTGCVCKMTSEYKSNDNLEIKEEDIEHGKDRAIGMYEVVEAYLLAHPHAYE